MLFLYFSQKHSRALNFGSRAKKENVIFNISTFKQATLLKLLCPSSLEYIIKQQVHQKKEKRCHNIAIPI